MERVPALWAVAYGSARTRPVRVLARCALRLSVFARRLAELDRVPFTMM
ncbi:hypothetical protein [Actinoplanes sp. NPDC020271]